MRSSLKSAKDFFSLSGELGSAAGADPAPDRRAEGAPGCMDDQGQCCSSEAGG